MAAKLDVISTADSAWFNGADLVPPRVNAPGSGCPEYDQVIAMLFTFHPGESQPSLLPRPVTRHFRIPTRWRDTRWQAEFRSLESDA